MLRCADESYYVGQTNNLEQRVALHEAGVTVGYTRTRLPFVLAWSQDFPSREEAVTCERQIKRWSRAKKEALAAGDWPTLTLLARSRGPTSSPRTDEREPSRLTPHLHHSGAR